MCALVLFSSLPNSHPFTSREINLSQPAKIGRSVARARLSSDNLTFDCKVLSRNHALMWYENNKFFLKDTNSSNGTYINGQRLGQNNNESPEHQIFSGDQLQFGVDVMENSRRVTHTCIIATVQLFHPDGTEAKPSHSSPFITSGFPERTTQSSDLYKLAQYLQDALHREQMLENKLATLQRLVSTTQQSSERGWQALIDEDRLLSRLELLENQLQAYSKNQSENTLRQEVTALQEEKHNYETTAKESLRTVLQEKLEAVTKLSDLERSLSNTEDECTHLKGMCEMSQQELTELATRHTEQLEEMDILQKQLKEAEHNHNEEIEKVQTEKVELLSRLEEMEREEKVLVAKVESLQADNDFTKKQLVSIKARLNNKNETDGETTEISKQSLGVQADIISLSELNLLHDNDKDLDESEDNGLSDIIDTESDITTESDNDNDSSTNTKLKKQLHATQKQIKRYKSQIRDSESRLQESKLLVDRLQGELEAAKEDATNYLLQITTLEEKVNTSDSIINKMVDEAVADLKLQLLESQTQCKNSKEFSISLQEKIFELENEISSLRCDRRDSVNSVDTVVPPNDISIESIESLSEEEMNEENNLRKEIARLTDLLLATKNKQSSTEMDVTRYKANLEEANKQIKLLTDNSNDLVCQLTQSKQLVTEKSSHIFNLQDQLKKTESTNKDVKHQIISLRDRLREEQEAAEQNSKDVQILEKELDQSLKTNEQDQEEVINLKCKIKELEEKLELTGQIKTVSDGALLVTESCHALTSPNQANIDTRKEDVRLNVVRHRAEFNTLREECSNLRQRIQDIEKEMKITRKENGQLSLEYTRLHESYVELEALKNSLETSELTCRLNLTDTQKQADGTKSELTEANGEIAQLKDECSMLRQDTEMLRQLLDNTTEEYEDLHHYSKTLSTVSIIPLLVLLVGVVMALYPTLSTLTATNFPSTS